MAKAARVLLALGVLLALDTWLPRASWMPGRLVTPAVLQTRLWPFQRSQSSAEALADDDSDSDDDDATPAPVSTSHSAKLFGPPAPASWKPAATPAVATGAGQTIVAAAAPPAPTTEKRHRRVSTAGNTTTASAALERSFLAPATAGWDDFRQRLAELEAGKRRKVRIVQLGDSEIAGDWVTRTLRKQFSRRYGEGGRGFALAMAPWPWYWREGYHHSDPDGFSVKSFVFGRQSDGNYGPGGIAFDSTKKGVSATLKLDDLPEGGCEIAFHYGTATSGGDVDVYADDVKLDHIHTAGPDRAPAVKHYTVADCPSSLTATVVTDAKVRIFGWSVETSKPGIVWSSLGVVSANASQLQHYSAAQLTQALQNLQPDLIVLGYGLNLVHTGQNPSSTERTTFESILAELRGGLKEARCLAMSPYPIVVSTDGALEPSHAVSVLARYQRDAAGEAGCAFLDRERLAGGPQTGLKWLDAKPRLLSGDYVHLTEIGSEHLGLQMARVLLDSRPETL